MLRSLAVNLARISDRKQQKNKDLSQEQEDRYRKWVRKVRVYLLQSAKYCIDKTDVENKKPDTEKR